MARILGVENHGSVVLVSLEEAGGQTRTVPAEAGPTIRALMGLQEEANTLARGLALGTHGHLDLLNVGYKLTPYGSLEAIWAEGYCEDLCKQAAA